MCTVDRTEYLFSLGEHQTVMNTYQFHSQLFIYDHFQEQAPFSVSKKMKSFL